MASGLMKAELDPASDGLQLHPAHAWPGRPWLIPKRSGLLVHDSVRSRGREPEQ